MHVLRTHPEAPLPPLPLQVFRSEPHTTCVKCHRHCHAWDCQGEDNDGEDGTACWMGDCEGHPMKEKPARARPMAREEARSSRKPQAPR